MRSSWFNSKTKNDDSKASKRKKSPKKPKKLKMFLRKESTIAYLNSMKGRNFTFDNKRIFGNAIAQKATARQRQSIVFQNDA